MKYLNQWRVLLMFILKVCLSSAALTVFNWQLLQDFNVLTRSFGLEITNSTFNNADIVNTNISNQENLNCTEKIETIKFCNSTFSEFVRSTTQRERKKLNSLRTSCPFGRYECLQNQVHRNELLQTWLQKFKSTVKTLCVNKCWKTLLLMGHLCKPNGKEVSELNSLNFLLDLMGTLCNEPTNVEGSCANIFLNGLTQTQRTHQPCNITSFVVNKKCSPACDEEIGKFFEIMGCCMHLVTTVLEKYRELLSNSSFGVLVATSAQRCHKNYRTCPQQDIHAATTPTTKTINPNNSSDVRPTTPVTSIVNTTGNSTIVVSTPTGSGKESSSSATLTAGVCVAVIICLFVVTIVVRCVYHRIQKRQKLRFEDYGYSRLKMMEDELYDVDGDEEHDGLISF